MPEQRQIIVKPNPVVEKQFGSRRENNIKSSFPNSPIHLSEISDEERREEFNKLVVDELVLNGNGMNSFSRDYEEAPDLNEVETGGGGKPSSPYTPNLTSPGPGSVNPSDQPAYNGDIPSAEVKQAAFGSGLGGTANPADTSKLMKDVGSLGEYISGRSYQGSDGKA